ncbi:hypothetical protein NQZ68_035483 [Dissostichus eleginoides]|nr:hypothetical protein NQZ68_035483 [Dissostichus eleginoides]
MTETVELERTRKEYPGTEVQTGTRSSERGDEEQDRPGRWLDVAGGAAARRRFTHSRRLPRTCPTRPPVHKGEDPPLSLLCQSRGRMTHAGFVRFPVIGREPIQSPVY